MTTDVDKKIPSLIYRIPPSVYPVAGLVLALVAGGLLIALSGFPPLKAYAAMLESAFGNKNGIGETLLKTSPLLLASLGVAVAFKGNVISIGAEGQIYMGAIGATYVGLFMGDLRPIVGIPLALLAGFFLGAIWGGIASFFKLRFGANEIIITLMMNYVAIEFTKYLVNGPWRDPSHTEPFSAPIIDGAELPYLLEGTRLHAGIIVAVLATAILWWVLKNTIFGYQLTVLGANIRTAEYAGVKTTRLILITMLISGGLCGLAGVSELSGVHHRLIEDLSPGYGYTAIAIALLGRFKPWSIMVSAILFAGLTVGVQGMQQAAGVPVSAALILQGLVLLFVVAGIMVQQRQEIAAQKREVCD
jgi:general nucleoside transport system permease protein